MDFGDAMDRALAQAREMQKQVVEATNKAAEQMKPHLQKSLDDARELQVTLSKHAAESGEIASQQAQTALAHVGDFIRMGSEALRESAGQTREVAMQMVDQSKKVVEAATAAMGKGPGPGPQPGPPGPGPE